MIRNVLIVALNPFKRPYHRKNLPMKGKNCDIFFIVHFGLQVNPGGTALLTTPLITSLILISVSEQNYFNSKVIIVLVLMLAQRKFKILNVVLHLDSDKSSMTRARSQKFAMGCGGEPTALKILHFLAKIT